MGKGKHWKKAAKAIVEADKKVTHAVARHRDHPVARMSGWVSELADQPPLIALAATTFGVGVITRRGDLVRGGARMLAAHLVSTAAKTALKSAIDRARPGHVLDTGDDRFGPGDGADDTRLNSFPSGHTAGAVAVTRAAAHDLPRAGVVGAVATGAAAVIQPATGKHYLLDTVAGGAVGWASEAVVSAVFQRIEPVVERWWRAKTV